ncbi:hypothetical protein ACHQM5_020778 [Ranunculus cassubicifolius]
MGDSSDEFSFIDFFQQEWMDRQRYYMNQLISSSSSQNQSEGELRELIARVLCHYQQYYAAKSRVAREDVFSLFAPPLFSTYERTFLWITGFKPGLSFSLVHSAVKDLSQEQLEKLASLKAETRDKERELDTEMAMIQESAATINLIELTKELGKQLDGATSHVNEVLEKLRERMERLVQSADYLRMKTGREVLEILSTLQAIKFLVAATKFQIRIRVWGKHRCAER